MATVNPTRDTTIPGGSVVRVTYSNMANGDTITPLGLGNAAGALLSIQFTANAGGVTTAQVSNDATNWETLKDTTGVDVSVASGATGIFDCSTAALWLRFNPGSGVTDADAIVVMREVES